MIPQTIKAQGITSVKPAALDLQDRHSNVVRLHRTSTPVEDFLRAEQEPALRDVANLVASGYTDTEIAEQFGWDEKKMAATIANIEQAKRAMLGKTREDWAAFFTYSAMDELADYRRARDAARVGLRHRDADRLDEKIARGRRDLFTMLERFGLVGPVDRSAVGLGPEGAGTDDILSAVLNSINGTTTLPEDEEKPKPLLRG